MAGPTEDETPSAIANKLITPKADGTPYSRLEMEERLRDIASTAQIKKLIAIETFGLSTKVAYTMKPITVIHWLLDAMISKGYAQGDKMNISSDQGADDVPETFNQFLQLLAIFIENGSALRPQEGEIPDMNKLNIPPPPGQAMAPGQPAPQPQGQGFTPPPPPPMPGAQPMMAQPPPAPTMAPAVGAPPGVPAQMPQMQMPMAPALPQGAQMPMPPQAPQAPQAPSLPPPVAPQPMASVPPPNQQAAPRTAPPILIKDDPNRSWGVTAPRTSSTGKPATRRLKSEIMEDQAWESAGKANLPTMTLAEAQGAGYIVDPETLIVIGQQNNTPQQPAAAPPPAPMAQPPQQMAQPPQPQMAQPASPMAPQQQMVPALPAASSVPAPGQAIAGQAPTDGTNATLRELAKSITELKRQNAILDMALSIVLRMDPNLKAALNSQGVASCEEVLKELNLQVPQ